MKYIIRPAPVVDEVKVDEVKADEEVDEKDW
jgi:hypothetical protein